MSRRLQAGLSMIELMVALVLSGLLILGLVQIFSASKSSYLSAQGLARAQEGSRFAIDALQHDARMAGHFGCVSDQAHFYAGNGMFGELFLSNRADYTTIPATREALRFDYSLRGFEALNTGPSNTLAIPATPVVGTAADWVPAVPAAFFGSLNPTPIRGSDLLVLRFLSPESAGVTSFTTGNAATITVDRTQWDSLTTATPEPALFGVADCRSVVMFQATEVDVGATSVKLTVRNNGLNQVGFDGSDTFASGQARLYRAESFVYYVGLNAKIRQPTLFRARFTAGRGGTAISLDTGFSEEVVEGVENMQLLYGQDTVTNSALPPTGVINGFQTAATLLPASDSQGGWQRVGSVQVGLLIRSPDAASTRQRVVAPRSLGTQLTLPQDTRYRAVYETNIALRNRLYGN